MANENPATDLGNPANWPVSDIGRWEGPVLFSSTALTSQECWRNDLGDIIAGADFVDVAKAEAVKEGRASEVMNATVVPMFMGAAIYVFEDILIQFPPHALHSRAWRLFQELPLPVKKRLAEACKARAEAIGQAFGITEGGTEPATSIPEGDTK